VLVLAHLFTPFFDYATQSITSKSLLNLNKIIFSMKYIGQTNFAIIIYSKTLSIIILETGRLEIWR